MKKYLLFSILVALLVTKNICAETSTAKSSNIYDDGSVLIELPPNSKPIDIIACGKNTVKRVPPNLTNYRCDKALYKGNEYLILKNKQPNAKRSWQYKLFAVGDKIIELGNLEADYSVLPLLVNNNSQLEFLSINIDRWAIFDKKQRRVSYIRNKLIEGDIPSLIPLANDGITATRKPLKSTSSTITSQYSKKQNDGGNYSNTYASASIIHTSVKPPQGAPSKEVIEKAVGKELQDNIPERWINMTIVGRKAQFHTMEIEKWGKVTDLGGGRKSYPVRIRVVGKATAIPPFGSPIPATFDELAEFRFIENDFGEWEHSFVRPNLFGN